VTLEVHRCVVSIKGTRKAFEFVISKRPPPKVVAFEKRNIGLCFLGGSPSIEIDV